MPTNFPTSLDALTNPAQTDLQTSPNHAGQHSDANDAIEALEAKVGINGSAVTTSLDSRIGLLDVLNEEVVQPLIHAPMVLSKFAHVEKDHGQVQAPIAAVATANADATYGQPEADLINELKTQLNLALAALRAAGIVLS